MGDVIFLRGVMGRSGTNYLHDLLVAHPDLRRSRAQQYEDFLTVEADRLVAYVTATRTWWPTKWPLDRDAAAAALLRELGGGLERYLVGTREPPVLAKTPDPAGIEHHVALFGHAPLLLLVRDPRSVVESAVRSFTTLGAEEHRFEWALHRWRDGARQILAFAEAHPDGRDAWWRIVRYEDLVTDLRPTLEPVLRLLDLDPAAYDWDAAGRTKVRGSSSFGAVDGKAQWDHAVEPDASFDPLRRYADWTPKQHHRVARVAGEAMTALGYEPELPDQAGVLDHVAAELRFRARDGLRRLARRQRLDGPET